MTDKAMYPITGTFEEMVAAMFKEAKLPSTPAVPLDKVAVFNRMSESLGEYEHGTTEPEDVFKSIPGFDLSGIDDEDERRRICLRLIAAVYEDLLLAMVYS